MLLCPQVNNAGMATRAAQPPAAGESVFTGEDPLAGVQCHFK